MMSALEGRGVAKNFLLCKSRGAGQSRAAKFEQRGIKKAQNSADSLMDVPLGKRLVCR